MAAEIEVFSELGVAGLNPIGLMNESSLDSQTIAEDPSVRELAGQLSRWVDNARAATGTTSMFDRGAYTPPDNPYDEMRAARNAMQYDSIVAGVAEVTESFAFQGVEWEGDNADESDVFNQISRDLDLDSFIRTMWREEYAYGQAVCGKAWGYQTYTVRGNTKAGNKKKKQYKVWTPLRLFNLDNLKCVPVGIGPLREDRIAWQATIGEIGDYGRVFRGEKTDPLMLAFFEGQYIPDPEEASEMAAYRIDPSRLLLMDRQNVFRHTITKPDYMRYPDIRMKSIFKLLDMKQQLMNSDRAALIGSANYILLVKKGDDTRPATGPELEHMRATYKYIAKIPVIISDHRISMEIIAPKTDLTLNSEKYDVLDQRILNRLLGTLTNGSKGSSRTDNEATTALPVARTMENRRHMLRRTLERELAHAIVNHPRNAGVFTSEPNLVYTPRNINLALDPSYGQALLALRTQREISRKTILEFYGLNEAAEALRMQMEAEYFDDIFKTEIPYTKGSPKEAPDPSLYKTAEQDSVVIPPGTTMTPPAGTAAPSVVKPAPAMKKALPKDAPNKDPNSQPASGQPTGKTAIKKTPNGTAESPKVSGARGGRPVGGGKTPLNPTKIAKAQEEGTDV